MIGWVRGGVFVGQMYLAMALFALVLTPLAALSRDRTIRAVHIYCAYVRWSARVIVGLRTEIRGEVPRGDTLVVSKHQSFLDVLLLAGTLPRPRFVMKRGLLWAPIVGWYARRLGCIAIDRTRGGDAKARILAEAPEQDGQLIIYPQGTRVAPGAPAPYRTGAALLYGALGRGCVPVATNGGVFWPRTGLRRRPGVAVLEFLPPIPPGLDESDALARMQTEIEAASDALLAAAHPTGARRR